MDYKEQYNIQFTDVSSLNRDGSWKHSQKIITNAEKKFLIDNGGNLRKDNNNEK